MTRSSVLLPISLGLVVLGSVAGGLGAAQSGEAGVQIENQYAVDRVDVASSTVPEGGFVVIHSSVNESLGTILGHSTHLDPGTHEGLSIRLDRALSHGQVLFAAIYRDSDENGEFSR